MDVGRTFASYAEFAASIEEYQKTNFIRLYKRESRTIEAVGKRVRNRSFNPAIVYGEIKYICVHGGTFYPKSTGQRPNRPTMKTDCPFMMRIAATEDGEKLVVKEMTGNHNHEVSEELYMNYKILPNTKRSPKIRVRKASPKIPDIKPKAQQPQCMEMVLEDPNSDHEPDIDTSLLQELLPQTASVSVNTDLSEDFPAYDEASATPVSADFNTSQVPVAYEVLCSNNAGGYQPPPKKVKMIVKKPANSTVNRWAGRVAVVTGASSGIGAGVARALVCLGMHVVGCARIIEPIQRLAKELSKEKGTLIATQCDVTREEGISGVFKRIRTDPRLGKVHVIVAATAVAHEAPLLSGEMSQWRDMLNVNVLGALVSIRETVRLMEETAVDDGHVFIINSMSGHKLVPNANSHFYAATKFMVTALTEGIRNELRERKSHTRVTAISPGTVETDFTNRMSKDPLGAQQFLSNSQSLTDKDVADAVVYILTAPPHVQVHDILMTSTEQSF